MGKAQSKRSVDITTETKKGPEGGDEVTGKLEKIEDIDQKQVNGDATPQEKNDAAGEKKDAPDETENEKDLTTEKTAAESTESSPTDAGDQANTTATETSPKEDASGAATPGPTKEGEETTPVADESLKKKSKKNKWSFRSISFGRKDKQKPAKAEGNENVAADAKSSAENAVAATNGDASETNKSTEGAAGDATNQDNGPAVAVAGAAMEDAKPVEGEKIENGVAADKEQQQMNGQKTPTPTDDAEQKKPIETSTAAVNETATVATTAVTTPAPAISSNEIVNESLSEMKNAFEKIEAVVSNGTADAEKNGDVHTNDHVGQQHEEKTVEDNNKSIPVDEKPHQNGTNGDEGVEDIIAATKTLQIEVKTEHQIDNVNSTITTTTIIPADNFNFEQNTTTDNLLITSAQTDIHTTTNTSDKSLSSNNFIAITEEQSISHPNKVLDTVEEISKVAVEPAEFNPIELKEEADEPQQQPPPLPLSAPPSQVAIFALKDNENNSEAVSPIITTTNAVGNIENEQNSSGIEKMEVIKTEATIERNENLDFTTESPKPTIEEKNLVCLEEIVVEREKGNTSRITECVEIIAFEDVPSKTEVEKTERQPAELLDEIAVQAFVIVDQIQKDLEIEDDDSQHQGTESEISLNDSPIPNENLTNVVESTPEAITDMVLNPNQAKEEHAHEPIGGKLNNEDVPSTEILTDMVLNSDQVIEEHISESVLDKLDNEKASSADILTDMVLNPEQSTEEHTPEPIGEKLNYEEAPSTELLTVLNSKQSTEEHTTEPIGEKLNNEDAPRTEILTDVVLSSEQVIEEHALEPVGEKLNNEDAPRTEILTDMVLSSEQVIENQISGRVSEKLDNEKASSADILTDMVLNPEQVTEEHTPEPIREKLNYEEAPSTELLTDMILNSKQATEEHTLEPIGEKLNNEDAPSTEILTDMVLSSEQVTDKNMPELIEEKFNNEAVTTKRLIDSEKIMEEDSVPKLLTDMVSNSEHIMKDNIPEIVVKVSHENEITETQDVIELDSALPSLSAVNNEIDIPIISQGEASQLEIEVITKNNHLSEQENEQRNIINHKIETNEMEDNSSKTENHESLMNLINANGDDKMNTVVSNEEDEGIIVSSNKEIPTAKDLKENAAAAEITQDLPVTCE